jgi:hypothetical protein
MPFVGVGVDYIKKKKKKWKLQDGKRIPAPRFLGPIRAYLQLLISRKQPKQSNVSYDAATLKR